MDKMNQYQVDLQEFIDNAKSVLKKFETSLGWNEIVDESLVQCPINEGHQIPIGSVKAHTRRCKWRKARYTQAEIDEIIEEEDCNFSGPCVFTDDIIAKVAPGVPPLRTHERFVSTLTHAERLQVYDQIIERLHMNKQKEEKPEIFVDLYAKDKSTASAKSNLETIKALRDHKRRRQTYRAKNVHVTKRSQTEIIRDVLAVHMEQLHKTWNPETSPTSLSRDDVRHSSRAFDRSPQQTRSGRRSSSPERRSYDDAFTRRRKDRDRRKRSRGRESRERGSHKHSRHDHESKKRKKKRSREEGKSHSKHKKHKSDRMKD